MEKSFQACVAPDFGAPTTRIHLPVEDNPTLPSAIVFFPAHLSNCSARG
jgi:hypothetical protein